MNQALKQIIKNTATPKNTLLFGCLVLIMAFFIMPEATRQMEIYAPGTNRIDGIFYQSPEKIYNTISAYGSKCRQLYVVVEASADFIYNIVTAMFLCSMLVWSSSFSNSNSIKFKYLLILPFLSFLFGSLENVGIIWLLLDFPIKHFFLSLLVLSFAFIHLLTILTCCSISIWYLALHFIPKFAQILNINNSNNSPETDSF